MIHFTTLTHTCFACPSQWEAETKEGEFYIIRFRHGHLTISGGSDLKQIFSYHSNESDGVLSTEDMIRKVESLSNRNIYFGIHV